MNSAKKQLGVTLLEVVLVLVIAASIMYFSMQQYLSYQRDANIRQLQANVTTLFQAASQYFRANCKKMSYIPIYPVSMNELKGYLIQPLPVSPFASDYLVQFDMRAQERQIGTYTGATGNLGAIVMWQGQISVKLNDQTRAQEYKSLLGANCLSSKTSDNTVAPCDQAPAGATEYAVFEQLPTLMNSDLWYTMPTVRQFTQMYTTYPILLLTDGTMTNGQYYVCNN